MKAIISIFSHLNPEREAHNQENTAALIRLRIDVDYAYPSRTRSFIHTASNMHIGKDYLKNAKIIAKMVNESPKDVKAYWFFTPKTIPDKEMLTLLENSKHEIALHIVNDPYNEWKQMENTTGKKVNYYTIHGTARLLARIMWKRWKTNMLKIPSKYPLQSFHQFPTRGLDIICYYHTAEQAEKIAGNYIRKNYVLHIHPVWLLQRGIMNRRGPFYKALRSALEVDIDLEAITLHRKIFFTIARDAQEYGKNIIPTEEITNKLRERGADIFTFIERGWCFNVQKSSNDWTKASDNVALLQVTSFEKWWKAVGKKTRNMVRKAEKSGITTKLAEPSERLAEGIWKIYNETPLRQGRGFPHYGITLEKTRQGILAPKNCAYIGAYYQEELAGFIQLVYGDNMAIMSQILSLQKHWDKAVNNALIAKAVEVCAGKTIPWLMYGRMGNHPSLDRFKINNGFKEFPITRHYIPLTRKGKLATKLKLHREIKDALPTSIRYPLIPLYNWLSRTKTLLKLRLKNPFNKQV